MPVSRTLKLGEEVYNEEMLIERSDGKVLPIIASTAPLRDMKGNITATIVVFEDTTERKKAEEELKKAKDSLEEQVQQRTSQLTNERKRLFDIMETVPIMICLLTSDYHVAFANRSFREKFGESKGRRCYDYCFGKSEPCEFCESYKVLETGKHHRWQVNGSDGSVIDAHDFPFIDVDGSEMILEMDIDVTEQKNLKNSLRTLKG